MLSEVALLLVQLRLADCPGPTLSGLAVRVTPRILMVADACVLTFPAPVAVAVKVVVTVGTIAAEPESATVVTSSPSGEGLMETKVAFVLVHERVVLCPDATTVGE